MKKYILITNSLSGSYNNKKINKVVKILADKGLNIIRYDLQKDEKIADYILKIDSNEVQNIILAFGDGTINSACNALLQRQDHDKFTIAVLPMGTANILAKELRCDNIKRTIKAITNNKITKVHIAKVSNYISSDNSITNINDNENYKYFALMASAGFDSWTVRNIDENLKKRIGKLAYIYEFLKIVIKKDFKTIKTHINGENIENILTCASNGKYYGAKIPITNSHLYNSDFDVIIIKKFNILSALQYMIFKKSNKNIIYTKTKNLTINSDVKDFPVQIDGDYYCNLSIKIDTTNKYLNFIKL